MTLDKESIKKEAKQIMDNFMQALGDIEVEEDFNLTRENCFRDETESTKLDENFQQRFLSNAPKTNGNAIVTSRGAWTK